MIQIGRTDQSRVREMDLARRPVLERVDAALSTARSAYITTLPGQDMIYQAKENEAKAYIALTNPPADLAEFPLLAGEVGITAPTTYELAQLWLNMAAQWRALAGGLENIRAQAKADVTAATTLTELAQAESDFAAALDTFTTNNPV